jgi:hypothetical protein
LIARHQIRDAALDDHPIIERLLQLGSEHAGVVGGHGSGKSELDQIAVVASKGLALVVLPRVRAVVEDGLECRR